MKYILRTALLVSAFAMINACAPEENTEAVGQAGWLKGTPTEKFEEITHQLQGFSRTMTEVGYRYQELYWAGKDMNWEYADYQVEHIYEAIEQGNVRRPEHEASGKNFVENILPMMEKAIASKDTTEFIKAFEIVTVNCNACHAMEEVPFLTVKTPTERQSPIRP